MRQTYSREPMRSIEIFAVRVPKYQCNLYAQRAYLANLTQFLCKIFMIQITTRDPLCTSPQNIPCNSAPLLGNTRQSDQAIGGIRITYHMYVLASVHYVNGNFGDSQNEQKPILMKHKDHSISFHKYNDIYIYAHKYIYESCWRMRSQ